MDKPIYLGLAVLELYKLYVYKTYYYKLQPLFGRDKVQLRYIDCDSFVLSIRTQKN